MKKQKPIQDYFCFTQEQSHDRKEPCQFAFNFSHKYLTDYRKLM